MRKRHSIPLTVVGVVVVLFVIGSPLFDFSPAPQWKVDPLTQDQVAEVWDTPLQDWQSDKIQGLLDENEREYGECAYNLARDGEGTWIRELCTDPYMSSKSRITGEEFDMRRANWEYDKGYRQSLP